MALQILSCRIPSGDNPHCGVTLEPYVVVKRQLEPGGLPTQVNAADLPEEPTDSRFCIRSRWYRSILSRGGSVCCIHPDREATIQCLLCLRCKVDPRRSYHCSTDCLKQHWDFHKELHEQVRAAGNGYTPADATPTKGENANGETWIEVGKTRAYTPTPEDIGSILKYEVVGYDSATYSESGKAFTVQTARVRSLPEPPRRALVPVVPSKPATGTFTVLTYNVLADLYATQEQFTYAPPWVLSWSYRRANLLRELLSYNADILCLQEVQSNHYAEFWEPQLAKHGYGAAYKKKTTEIYTAANAFAMDGCATFFRTDRFALVKKYEVEFNKAAKSLSDTIAPEQRDAALSRMLKDNVALISVLEALDMGGTTPAGTPSASQHMHGGGVAGSGATGMTGSMGNATPGAPPRRQLVCVANTHIHANPELNDVKLWQVSTLLKGLEKIATSADIPMIVAGDFNSIPGSAAHNLLVHQGVDPNHQELRNDPLGILQPLSKLQHHLPLASAYAAFAQVPAATPALQQQRRRMDMQHKEPRITNNARDFQGTLDYVLYTTDSLRPVALLELPDEAELRKATGLPNDALSSDHVALMAEFALAGHWGGV